MFYFKKTPGFLKRFYKDCIWEMDPNNKSIYLTFDDGPHPEATAFVLDQLKQYDARATFFCIGNNVSQYEKVYNQVVNAGHKVGNHTYDHVNGWQTTSEYYLQNIETAGVLIKSDLFRPPYGRITKDQIKSIKRKTGFKIIMWTVLSGDFDKGISKERCLDNVLKNAGAGSIIVFHDSVKAFEKMSYALPLVLKHFKERGFEFKVLE